MKNNKLKKLEAIRGFSALYVVLFHMLPQKIYFLGINVGILFRFGSEAVILFFVLSGFVIKYSWEKSTDKSFHSYFIRRFIRIYIPLFFIFLIGYLLKCYSEGALANPEWKTLLGNIFMLQDVISLKPNVVSPTYMGNGLLWSLSYEWWFYMLFIFLTKKISKTKINTLVNIIVIVAAISYLIYPFIVNRIAMYFAIWWIGVKFADIYLTGGKYSFKSMLPYAYVVALIITILGLNFYLNFSYTKIYKYPLVAYPFVELRHFIFSFIIMFGAIIWHRWHWIGFNNIFGIFKYFAPFSYVIYISHDYLVVKATYLNFINHKIVEYVLYFILMLLFSYLIEVIVYKRIKKYVMYYFVNKSIKN
ncbi:Peptidoglycan/LPS O-acetylase OafA/YrhL, contains acyltransferase and SGNH-hydrolase domains [Lutibacter oricola]|uniref:Peptidoglycan/LPS O-acetylase OafA/YrhL, contains acyltransferase and SGNH-hydrolase domains n=1 Tax=Lutibacter oricola TaxID=762486 RepID=A0A1H2YT67_9FLAO|nr:acyltransferase [Lutibacter oricola]SDX07854.1 Peptidoglycan/LPS O-acetylase OafA/YrhL, contains acyltransferase and SGNH-hydrolase domains [Lutibacter oricola]